MVANEHFFSKLRDYVKKGNRVAELYHGEKDDILRGLAEIVTDEGAVYGVDNLNPFHYEPNMQELQLISNLKLIRAVIPPLPAEVTNLDAIMIREFLWTYPMPMDASEDPETYEAIDKAINPGGHLILHLNKTEQEHLVGYHPIYPKTIARQLPNFKKVYNHSDMLVYGKGE
jgi:hypothetical protein